MVSTRKKGLTNVLLIDVTDMLHSPTVKLNLQRKQTMQEKRFVIFDICGLEQFT